MKKNIIIAQQGTKLYTIKKGDTLWDIAKKFTGSGINYKQIAKLNNISNPDLIYAGATIKISVKDNLSPSNKPTKYSQPTTLKPLKEKLKLPLYTFTEPDYSSILTLKSLGSKKENTSKSNSKKEVKKLYEWKELEPFVPTVAKKENKTKENKAAAKPEKILLYEFKLLEPFFPTITYNRETSLKPQTKVNVTKRKPIKVTHDYIGNSLDIITPSKATSTSNTPVINSPIDKLIGNLYNKIPEDYRTPIDLLKSGNIEGLSSYISTAYDRKFSDNYKGVQMKSLNTKKAKETQKYRLSEPSVFDIAQAQPQQRTGILGKSISYMNMPYDINIKDYKWHYRLRGDMGPVQHTYGMLAPIFETMTTKDDFKPGRYNGIIFNPKTGELSVEPDINKVPKGWLINNTSMLHFNVKGMKKDSNGNLIMVTPNNGEYKYNFTTEYEMTNGFYKLPNVFTDSNNKDPRTLGAKAGGHFIISAQPKKGNKQTRLVHGSLQHLSDAIDRLKANTNTEYVTVYPLDGGSFSMGYIPPKAVGAQGMLWVTIEPSEINKYQFQNPRGSSGFMPIEVLPAIPDTTYITE